MSHFGNRLYASSKHFLLAAMTSLVLTLAHAGDLTITWEAANRFPLFKMEMAELKEKLTLENMTSVANWADTVLANDSWILKSIFSEYLDPYQTPTCNKNLTLPTVFKPCEGTYESSYFDPPTGHDILVGVESAPAGICKYSIDDNPAGESRCSEIKRLRVRSDVDIVVSVVAEDGTEGSAKVHVKDVLLLAFGDSFSSGEGNPDVPVSITRDFPVKQSANRVEALRTLKETKNAKKAIWLDERCHRSTLSWPIMSSLRLALEHKDMVVRIASWACTGAQIPDGFLKRQPKPVEKLSDVPKSQYAFARDALCRTEDKKKREIMTRVKETVCPEEQMKRKVDAVMFSLGGNVVFFAPMIKHAVLITGFKNPFLRALNPFIEKYRGKIPQPPDAHRRIMLCSDKNKPCTAKQATESLTKRYSWLAQGLGHLNVSPDKVYQLPYPNVLWQNKKPQELCTPKEQFDHNGYTVISDKYHLPLKITGGKNGESAWVNNSVYVPLLARIQDNATLHGWKIVDGYLQTMRAHGICAYDNDFTREYAFPYFDTTHGSWEPFSPWEYKHYSQRARWIHTLDDVFLGQNSGELGTDADGLMHPTARAHAEMADEMVKILEKQLIRN